MSIDFTCPHCKGQLCTGEHIVLTFKKNRWNKGLLLLHPEIGNYTYKHHSSYSFGIGEKVEFYCPICNRNLTSRKHSNLAHVNYRDEDGKNYQVYFSKVAGEKSTYKLIGDFVEIHGENSSMYADFFDMNQLV